MGENKNGSFWDTCVRSRRHRCQEIQKRVLAQYENTCAFVGYSVHTRKSFLREIKVSARVLITFANPRKSKGMGKKGSNRAENRLH